MKYLSFKKLNKKKTLWFFLSLVTVAGIGAYVYFSVYGADEPSLNLNQVASVAYVDYQSGQGAVSQSSNMAGIEKVSIPTLATDFQAVNGSAKAEITGTIKVLSESDSELGSTELKPDTDGKSLVDWTDVKDVQPNNNYNLVVKAPGFLAKHINSVKLNSSEVINTGKIYGGDSNGDGVINMADFAMLMSNWNQQQVKTDYNRDGTTNISDFAVMLGNWNKTEANQ